MSTATEQCSEATVSRERCCDKHRVVDRTFRVLFILALVYIGMMTWAVAKSHNAEAIADDVKTRVAVCESRHKDLKDYIESKVSTLRGYHGDRRTELRQAKEELLAVLAEQRKVLDKLLEANAGTD